MKPHRILLPGLALALTPLGLAQNDISWVSFHQDDTLLNGDSGTLLNDQQEKDYAWGDLDNDGWTDLVIVRKQPYTTGGRYPNVLLMNEGGTLTDRTAQYASATDVPGDQGFLTPTNDRDVILGDVDLDGWLDVITCTTITPNQPKSLSHPRVYMNLGQDSSGQWLGLEYQESRIPDFGTYPNFCGVGIGDVTGDGYPDLYFAHYHQSAVVDLNDRLLINDGTGSFGDESATRMTPQMLDSSFGVSAVIADMNGDGVADIVKDTALGSTGASGPKMSVSYNNPNSPGMFNVFQEPYLGAPYHTNVGDLNQDGKPDVVIADDGSDRYMLNQGNDPFGRVIWSSAYTYNTDDGFGSNNLVADLDGDNWNDVLICDVDVDIPSCSRRLHIYHNRGGTVGGFVTLHEESGGGDRGITGMSTSDMTGTHDVAVFDLDNDGDNDMVIGRCSGTDLWINDTFTGGGSGPIGTPFCSANANSTGFPGLIQADGSTSVGANNVTLTASLLPQSQFGLFIVSSTQANIPVSQGNLCVGGQIGRFSAPGQIKNSGSAGSFSLSIPLGSNWPVTGVSAVQAGDTWHFSTWFRDVGAVSNFTNGVSITFQ
jgi:hypothetical protein